MHREAGKQGLRRYYRLRQLDLDGYYGSVRHAHRAVRAVTKLAVVAFAGPELVRLDAVGRVALRQMATLQAGAPRLPLRLAPAGQTGTGRVVKS
ncbi:hypothetical protein LJ737_00845 [Hymenobacter sp. 15J16-1T3B]|uniref:hypothetical protein n=1 Tax=Hymenobacter sp. 15J16-1T3B TaxID=2886941 RepID=UPI001D121436|nr:hypothetical protein [Hymenobacter sp. 15J16-1T3B]MCC3155764.1 hypothetical protein [Hymenobacter sp. 15J16-1T3B]